MLDLNSRMEGSGLYFGYLMLIDTTAIEFEFSIVIMVIFFKGTFNSYIRKDFKP